MFDSLVDDLYGAKECQAVLTHPLFDRIKREGLSCTGAETLIGQFWHPSHYFPSFLAGLISVAPTLGVKTSLSRILWQELGEGDPQRAHESIYVDTVTTLGLADPSRPEDAPLPATARLVELYREASASYTLGLGSIYATEAIDLTVVQALGSAVTAATGERQVAWVDIHAEQESDHMESATAAVDFELDADGRREVRASAERMWNAWYAFYSAVEAAMFEGSERGVSAGSVLA